MKLLIALLLGVAVLLGSPTQALAQSNTWTGVCVEEDDVATIQGLQCLIGNVLSVAVTAIGLVGFVIFIISGFRYMMAGTDTKNTKAAIDGIKYGVAGLVMALSAFIILNLISAFTGIDFTNFIIPDSDTPIQRTGGGGNFNT